MRIARPKRPPALVSLTPLIDVLLILVVFFLVTSTYLDLDMIPMAGTEERAAGAGGGAGGGEGGGADAARPSVLLLRIDAAGRAHLGAESVAPDALAAAIRSRLAAQPSLRLLVLPSPSATTQALVDALGAAAQGGAASVRVVRVAPAGANR